MLETNLWLRLICCDRVSGGATGGAGGASASFFPNNQLIVHSLPALVTGIDKVLRVRQSLQGREKSADLERGETLVLFE